jgi:hypothetical protein
VVDRISARGPSLTVIVAHRSQRGSTIGGRSRRLPLANVSNQAVVADMMIAEGHEPHQRTNVSDSEVLNDQLRRSNRLWTRVALAARSALVRTARFGSRSPRPANGTRPRLRC